MSRIHNQYDITLKKLLKDVPVRFLKILTGHESGVFIDVQLPEVQMRQADLVIEAPDTSLVHLELQSTNDDDMLGRMYLMSALIVKENRKLPRQIVLYVGNERLRMKNVLKSEQVYFSYDLVDIREIDCRLLLESDKPEDIVLAILCRTDDMDGTIHKILQKLSPLPEREREDYILKLLCLSDLRMVYNKVIEEVKNMPITIDLRKSEMFKEGIREGIREGERKGERKGLLIGIEAMLEMKFGSEGLTLMDKVQAIKTLKRLEKCKDAIKTSNSMDELVVFLKRGS